MKKFVESLKKVYRKTIGFVFSMKMLNLLFWIYGIGFALSYAFPKESVVENVSVMVLFIVTAICLGLPILSVVIYWFIYRPIKYVFSKLRK